MFRVTFILLLLLADAGIARASEEIPLDDFLAPDDIGQLLISPDGEHYAVTVPMQDRTALAILRRSDLKRSGHVMFRAGIHVHDVRWVNDDTLVYTDARRFGKLARPQQSGTLYRIRADGSDSRPVSREWVRLHDTLRGEDDLVQVIRYNSGGSPRLARIRLANGDAVGGQVKLPVPSGSFHADNTGAIRFASGYKFGEIRSRQFQREASGKWREINSEASSGVAWNFAGFSADNQTAYLIIEHAEGPDGFYSYDPKAGTRKLLFRHPRVDIGRVLRSPVDGGVIALEYFDGKPTLQLVAPRDPFAKALVRMAKAFPEAYVTPTSYTRDGRIGIYFVSSDVNSGEYYRVDHDTGQAAFVIARSERLAPDRMAPMTPFRFKARDGLEVEGLVTRPRVAAGQTAPLVVMPHGGPTNVFDQWGFDREVQLLANRGYAVLQVNFRGSGNYGRAFREAANGQWGAKMQDDITDATLWAIDQGIAERGRICLYGASYGAYASMMGLIREPGLYACGIGNVGLYDMVEMYSDQKRTRSGRDYFETAVGNVDLASISPARMAAKIRVPVLLGAGVLDETTPLEQTRAMQKGLENAGQSPEVALYEGEAHGYYLRKNQRDWAQRVLRFLDTQIGQARRPAAATE